MGIKGKTTFELTDVSTGEVEVIEESNMITNALQEFLTSYGYFGCNVLNVNENIRKNELWKTLLGGLFLFDTALDEDVNNIFMPAGVKMVGNGAKDISNNGNVLELGSYNAIESGVQTDGSIKMVYDFGTNQANGTIACACLTSTIGGYIGMGNASGYNILNSNMDFERFNSKSYETCVYGIDGHNNNLSHLLYPVYNENAIYFTNPYNITYTSGQEAQHWSNTKKIQILKARAGFTGVNINDTYWLNKVVETYDVDIPQNILDYMGTSTNYVCVSSDGVDRNVYLIFYKDNNNYFKTNTSCWIMKIDKNMNATSYQVTNNLSKDIYIKFSGSVYCTFNGDYWWVLGVLDYNYNLYGIKYSDSTQIIETGINTNGRRNMFNISKDLIGMFGDYKSDNYESPYTFDAVNRTYGKTNGKCYLPIDNGYHLIPFPDKKGVYLKNHSGTIYVIKDPRYLATINNLTEPVVKTASKTMKVTYTISFEG